MNVISVGGGKGGTGKSTIAVNVAILLSKAGYRVLLVDADVESPIDHIMLGLERKKQKSVTAFSPKINAEKCIRCGVCIEKCPEHALIGLTNRVPILLKDLCEGCKLCFFVCPVGAIEDEGRNIGAIYEGENYGIKLIQGEVFSGIKQHVNVSLATIRYAEKFFEGYEFIVIDSPPGTGAGVWLPLIRSNIAIAVTEPTPLGASDLKRYLYLTNKAKLRTITVLNKADIPGGAKKIIYKIAEEFNSSIIEVPYDPLLMNAYVNEKPAVIMYPDSEGVKALMKLSELLINEL